MIESDSTLSSDNESSWVNKEKSALDSLSTLPVNITHINYYFIYLHRNIFNNIMSSLHFSVLRLSTLECKIKCRFVFFQSSDNTRTIFEVFLPSLVSSCTTCNHTEALLLLLEMHNCSTRGLKSRIKLRLRS